MRVLLVGNYPCDRPRSMENFCEMLRVGLSGRGHEVRVVRPEPVAGRLGPPHRGLRKWLGYADKFLAFPPRLARAVGWAEVAHVCDQANAIYTRYLRGVPHVVTCHDLMAVRAALGEFPGVRVRWTGRRYQALVRAGLGRAHRVACDSESTRRDLLRLTRLGADRVATIPLGLHRDYAPADDLGRQLRGLGISPERPYVLHVGAEVWYKNRRGVLETFLRLTRLSPDRPLDLVLAGDPIPPDLRRFIVENGLEGRVLERRDVPDAGLRVLYSGAGALLFPSLFEGFGWPVLEAQACGCPVVCSDRGSLSEVAGDGALIAPPDDAEALARMVGRLLDSPQDRADLIGRGFANAARFDTGRTIDHYERIYRDAIERPPSDVASPTRAGGGPARPAVAGGVLR